MDFDKQAVLAYADEHNITLTEAKRRMEAKALKTPSIFPAFLVKTVCAAGACYCSASNLKREQRS